MPCRVYAPVGSHEDLLPYLVRRLLENGANTSFVNRITDEAMPPATLVADPVATVDAFATKPHPNIPQPSAIFADRKNSMGVNLANDQELAALADARQCRRQAVEGRAAGAGRARRRRRRCRSPIRPTAARPSATGSRATPAQVEQALVNAQAAFNDWDHTAGRLARQAARGRRRPDGSAHARADRAVREGSRQVAVAPRSPKCARRWTSAATTPQQGRKLFGQPEKLPGPTGESNELQLHGRGVFVCISPWNFPLAIFIGQVAAALAAGNTVIAKPAEQTNLIALLRRAAAARSRRAGRRAAVAARRRRHASAPR